MAHYLVTGGCGFIGSHLVDALVAAGHQVRILDDLSTGKLENVPAGAEIVVGDVGRSESVAQALAGLDGCFHLAAIASVQRANEEWVRTHRVNLTGAINVFDAASRDRIPIVYASSAAVYGDNPNMPLVETGVPRPLNAYGADKLGCELHASVAGGVHEVPNVGLRFFNVYGERQDPRSPYSGVISIFADRIARNLPISINGDGGQARDFILVADVVEHLLKGMAAASTSAPVFNVCTGEATTILTLAQLMGRMFGRSPEISYGPPRPGDIRQSVGSPEHARRALGIKTATPIEAGLATLFQRQRRAAA